MQKIIFGSFTLLLALHSGFALKCYKHQLSDGNATASSSTCNMGGDRCFYGTVTATKDGVKKDHIHQECISSYLCGTRCSLLKLSFAAFSYTVDTCSGGCCEGDDCNSGPIKSNAGGVTTATLVVIGFTSMMAALYAVAI